MALAVPTMLSTMLFPLMIPVVATKNFRPAGTSCGFSLRTCAWTTKETVDHLPLFCRPTQRSAAISVYVHPPRKNTTVVVGRSLGSTVGRRAHGGES